MLISTWFCAKCGRVSEKGRDASGPYLGLCDDCRESLSDKFNELIYGDESLKRELTKKYGVKHIEEAYVIQHWGRPRHDDVYSCDNCGREISKPTPERTGATTEIQSFSPVSRLAHSCESCYSDNEYKRKRNKEESDRDFRKSFFS